MKFLLFLLFSSFLLNAFAIPLDPQKNGVKAGHIREIQPRIIQKDKQVEKVNSASFPLAPPLPINKAGYNFAVDLSQSASSSNFQCLKQNNYQVAFIRVYMPSGSGQVDQAGIQSIKNAANIIGTEAYVTPQAKGSAPGYQAFDDTYSALQNAGVSLRTIWLQVTSPVNWNSNQQYNINFITSFVQRAMQYGVTPGIYTSQYDWQQITSSWTGINSMSGPVYLWYWHVLGQGPSGESSPDFSDYRQFGGWVTPNVKQFAQYESLCGLTINRDVYPVGSKQAKVKSITQDLNKLFVGCAVTDC